MVLLRGRLDGPDSVLFTALASFDGLGYRVEAELVFSECLGIGD
jgi:hypothetical protein